ncbi:hypothetical protein PVAND_009924 [Polypedilum vanderplanki]|uniref:C2H2-type domain-containing protein n=1 Tax=Polypedilum vanderplanki TaxID=319348 RepID=A0A9J6CF32_POLVA|nr:hypothetical protein PVAND_009924 [Polypedilum vanderplanki]
MKLSIEIIKQIYDLLGEHCNVDCININSRICHECKNEIIKCTQFKQRFIETQKKFQCSSLLEIKLEPYDEENSNTNELSQTEIKIESKYELSIEPITIIDEENNHNKYLESLEQPQKLKSSMNIESKRKIRRKNTPSEKDHFCKYCSKYFTEARKVKDHIKRVHLRRKDYKCDHCSYCAYKKYDIYLHITNIHKPKSLLEKTAICPTCGLAFLTNSRLNIHIRRKHLQAIMRKLKCDICGHSTVTLNELRCHMKIHLRKELREKYNCEFCEAVFISKGSLKTHKDVKHLRTNIEIKCFCGKIFKQKSVYQRHYDVIHLGQKAFKCSDCNKAFSGKTHLDYHKKAAHSDEISSIPCEICGKLYKSAETLKRHLIYHSDDPKYKCAECGRMFYENKKLLDHQSVHKTLEFPCIHCDKSFRLETQLNYHLKKVHFKEKLTFKCELCLTTFTRKSTYRDHALRQHKELSQDSLSEFLKRIKKSIPEEHK